MKFLVKVSILAGVAGIGATMYAAPGDGAMADVEMMTRAGSIHDQIQTDLQYVMQMQMTARREKDLIKLNCINDKLVQLKPQLNICEHAQVELQSSRGGDQQTPFNMIVQAGEQSRQLREAAEQCIGKPMLATESSNEYTHPHIPDYPTSGGTEWTVEPPAYASPFN